jgi:hypothetical protein
MQQSGSSMIEKRVQMACLMNYTIQCRDVVSGKIGCFLFDEEQWQQTGEFKAISPVYPDLDEFYRNTNADQRQSRYLERT